MMAVVVVVLVVVALLGGTYYYSSTITTSISSTSALMTTTGPSSTLSIVDYQYPSAGTLNQLWNVEGNPFPDWLLGAVYQTLVAVNLTAEQRTGQFQLLPCLATGWAISSDGTTYTLNLRQGVTYSDGNPFNAYSLWTQVYMFYYLSGNSSAFWQGLDIFNTTAVNVGPSTFDLVAQSGLASPSTQLLQIMSNPSLPIYVTGPYEIVFRLAAPFPFFLGTLTGYEDLIFDPMFVMQHGGPGTPTQYNSYFDLTPIPGTGPYVVTQAQMSVVVELQQNPTYWGSNLTVSEIDSNPFIDPGHFKTILIYSNPSDTNRYIQLTTGKVDMADIEGELFSTVQSNPSYGVVYSKYAGQLERLIMNTQAFPFNNTDLRQAVVHAINYTDLIQKVVYGYGTQFMGPSAPSWGQFYDPGNFPPYQYNVSLAEQYMVKAGYPDGKGLPPLTFQVESSGVSWQEPMAELIQSYLSQIGITTVITVVPHSVWKAYRRAFEWNYDHRSLVSPLTMQAAPGFAPDYMSPTDYWTDFVCTCSTHGNYAIYNNSVVDSAISYSVSHSNVTAILQQLQVAQQQVYNDAPYGWLFIANLPSVDGSYVYNRAVISNYYLEPNLLGVSDIPLPNTIS
jgi:peptide/nickel transport system substrate-binding protein